MKNFEKSLLSEFLRNPQDVMFSVRSDVIPEVGEKKVLSVNYCNDSLVLFGVSVGMVDLEVELVRQIGSIGEKDMKSVLFVERIVEREVGDCVSEGEILL